MVGVACCVEVMALCGVTSYWFMTSVKVIVVAVAVMTFLATVFTPAILCLVGPEKSEEEVFKDDEVGLCKKDSSICSCNFLL